MAGSRMAKSGFQSRRCSDPGFPDVSQTLVRETLAKQPDLPSNLCRIPSHIQCFSKAPCRSCETGHYARRRRRAFLVMIVTIVAGASPQNRTSKRDRFQREENHDFLNNIRYLPEFLCRIWNLCGEQPDIPRGHKRVPMRMGRGDLCRLPLGRRHREGQRRVGLVP